jgi:hypothetical protein
MKNCGKQNFKNQNDNYLEFIYLLYNKVANKYIQFKKGINKTCCAF